MPAAPSLNQPPIPGHNRTMADVRITQVRSAASHKADQGRTLRALGLTRANAVVAKTPNIVACLPDEVPPELRFAAIYSNPPVRVGKGPLHEMLQRWLPRLAPGANAYLVVQRNLGSDSLAAWLAAQGYNVQRLKSKKGYRLLSVAAGTPPQSAEGATATPILSDDPAST